MCVEVQDYDDDVEEHKGSSSRIMTKSRRFEAQQPETSLKINDGIETPEEPFTPQRTREVSKCIESSVLDIDTSRRIKSPNDKQ